ncbi:MAG: anhydro-N-acetylmuramic acid kinase [Nitrospinae bacterium]|nr:anhydro-N-acetylmuramic acid kinase [Nitrospinota bacterium]
MPLVIGLMSGTSADGVDAALIHVEGSGPSLQVQVRAFDIYPFPAGMQEAILRASDPRTGSVDLICRLNVVLGEAFAQAAIHVARRAGVSLEAVDFIGSHGQTIHHLPEPASFGGYTVRATLQLGEPCVIAERTGVTTVADFRTRDVAAGGEGAPLAPYVHYLLFGDAHQTRVVHNMGGISNVTILPAGCALAQVSAFDTGPGNMVIDGTVSRLTEGRDWFDRGGLRAMHGQAYHPLVQELLTHPFLSRPPPKSTGREAFGVTFVDDMCRRASWAGVTGDDLVATATMFTASSVIDAYQRFVLPEHPRVEVVLCGGGSHNPALIGQLRAGVPQAIWRTSDELGIAADALEAVIFAVLAYETLCGRAGNVPAATGARRAAILGKVIPGREGWKRLLWQG